MINCKTYQQLINQDLRNNRETEMNAQPFQRFSIIVIFAAITFASVSANDDELTSTATIKSAIERSLPYIEEKGFWWMKRKDCMSCHRTSFMAWSHIEASRAGVEVDNKTVNAWIDWCNDDLFEAVAEKDRKYDGELSISRNLSGGAQMLALSKNWQTTESQKSKQKSIIQMLREGQQKDGSWTPGGQLPFQKRDVRETAQVITIWNALALHNAANFAHVDGKKFESSVAAAANFAREYDSGKSSEWMAIRGLLEFKIGDQTKAANHQKQLFGFQNEDGGWGWIAGEPSDVLATAQVLYVLIEMNVPNTDRRMRRAIQFILSQQQKNGFWKVNGTKAKAKSRPTETANYWGTCWAVIALSKYLSTGKTSG